MPRAIHCPKWYPHHGHIDNKSITTVDKKDIDKYRQALGKSGENLTDDQVITCTNTLKQMATILVDEYLKQNDTTK